MHSAFHAHSFAVASLHARQQKNIGGGKDQTHQSIFSPKLKETAAESMCTRIARTRTAASSQGAASERTQCIVLQWLLQQAISRSHFALSLNYYSCSFVAVQLVRRFAVCGRTNRQIRPAIRPPPATRTVPYSHKLTTYTHSGGIAHLFHKVSGARVLSSSSPPPPPPRTYPKVYRFERKTDKAGRTADYRTPAATKASSTRLARRRRQNLQHATHSY